MDKLKKPALLVIVILSYLVIMCYIAPRVEYIVDNNGKEMVISVDGKPTWRPLSKDDITDSILTKK